MLLCCRMTGGELFEYLARREKVDEATATMFLRQVLNGLNHLHEKNIVHLDLKVSGSDFRPWPMAMLSEGHIYFKDT